MQTLHFGAIDIGSNAARLLITSVGSGEKEPNPKKSVFVRVPLRLGEDVFATGEISPQRLARFVQLMSAYKNLLQVYDTTAFRICATSAMRDARNSQQVARFIHETTGLEIEIISGKEEAQIIYESHIADQLDPQRRYIYVDVGGGSTEITLIKNQRMGESCSFDIGTLRLLAGKVKKEEWLRMTAWLEKHCASKQPLEIIGSGGNINKLSRMAKSGNGEKLSIRKLKALYEGLKTLTVDERITRLAMRPDRADVIVPAAEIFLRIAKTAKVKLCHVPTIGLCDGIVHLLYQDYLKQQKRLMKQKERIGLDEDEDWELV